MKILKNLSLPALALVALAPLASAQDAPAPQPSPVVSSEASTHGDEATTTLEVVGGGQLVNDVEERGRARFEEFRDVPQGAVLDFVRFRWAAKDGDASLDFTARDAFQDDQRYALEFWNPSKVRVRASFVEIPRFYSSGSRTLYSGVGTANLTIPESSRQAAESAGGSPTSPVPSAALVAYMRNALAGAHTIDLRTERKDLAGNVDFELARDLTLSVNGRYELREGTRPLGFGTYIRRQGLSGIPGTGTGFFWRETVESRGNEIVEPLDYATSEFGATLTWARSGHSATAGFFGSQFRNDNAALDFDNPFEASPGRASAVIFDPRADQETAAPNGNNSLRGLFARSSVALFPDNDYTRVFATASLKLPRQTRLAATVARGSMTQDVPFLPYAENDQVVFSGTAGQPGAVYARNAALPQASLDGEMTTTQADVKLTSRVTDALSLRAGYRLYQLDDERPHITFPGFSSSGDAYFRAGIGQKDAAGNRTLFNNIGGYDRNRLNAGAAYRFGRFTVDGEYVRTVWDYEERQVDKTTEDSWRGTLRMMAGEATVNAFYQRSKRDYEGAYAVGLESSGVRAFDVWTRERDQVGVDVDVPLSDEIVVALGGSLWKDEYPGAVDGFAYGWGLQDSRNGSLFAGLTWARDEWMVGAFAGVDSYEWNSLQVTKTSLGADYNPVNRWTRESADDVVWIGLEAEAPLAKNVHLRGNLDFQKFDGEWITTNLATPDVNSAVAYPFPELSDRTISAKLSLRWDWSERIGFEGRYLYEPYRLDDFTTDVMQPYMQGQISDTRSSASDIGDANVSRFLFLDARYSDYTAHVLSALVHVTF